MTRYATLATALATVLAFSGPVMAAGSGASGTDAGAATQKPAATAGTQAGATGGCPARSQVDADNDGTISDQEARRHRDEVFAALDANNDNVVSNEEYRDCLAKLQPNQPLDLRDPAKEGQAGSQASAGSGENAFEKLDADGNGSVSLQEMMTAHRSRFEARAQDGRIQIEQGSTEGAGGFEAADMDNDGAVTADEASAMAALSFAMVDTDGDGRISSQEWSTFEQQAQQQADRQDQQQNPDFTKAFNAIDADSDGQISKKEFSEFGSQAFAEAGKGGEPVTIWVYREYYAY